MKEQIICLGKSLFFSVVTLAHFVLNKFSKKFISNKILIFEKENDIILNFLEENKNVFCLQKNTVYSIKSFFSRINEKTKISFNQIIKKPFTKILINNESLENSIKDFYYVNYKVFLKNSNIKKIVLYDEYSLPSYTLTKAAKELGIKVYALQHGIFNDKKYCWLSKNEEYFPNATLVFSETYKKELIKINNLYDEKNIFVVGNPRYDYLSEFLKKKDIKFLKNKFGINNNKKNILWTTQTHGFSKEENLINCKILFSFFKKNKNKYNFLIKLHPNEKQKNNIYNKFNKKNDFIAKIYDNKFRTDELQLVSDLNILKHSTVGMESILLNVPVLIIDFKKISYFYKVYVDNGFDMIVTNEDELDIYINKIFHKSYFKNFLKNRNKFISKNFPYYGKSIKKINSIISIN